VSNVTAADLIKTWKVGAHYVGTAKMGKKGDAGVVVDTDTKVYGTDNLFVVDASMHPDLPTGNTQAIIMVAAEAAAARILKVGGGVAPAAPETSGVASSSKVPVATPTASASMGVSSVVPVATSIAPVQSSAAPLASSVVPVRSSEAPVASSTTGTPVASSTPSAPAQKSAAPAPVVSVVEAYNRCGGIGHEGPTECTSGWTCKVQNPYYSQCIPA
jgi:cellobiose dehydrogenase (acceptor)